MKASAERQSRSQHNIQQSILPSPAGCAGCGRIFPWRPDMKPPNSRSHEVSLPGILPSFRDQQPLYFQAPLKIFILRYGCADLLVRNISCAMTEGIEDEMDRLPLLQLLIGTQKIKE